MEKPSLYNPHELQLDDAYRCLPNLGMIVISVDRTDLAKTLKILERIGFVAMEIMPDLLGRANSLIKAYKGKHGPCFDTRRKASYIGAALAALDDDNHLLIKGIEKLICEKTAQLYRLPPYAKLITVNDSTPLPEASQLAQPVRFQDNRFEEDQETLMGWIATRSKEPERCLFFYPGPFRLLILSDGTIVRRGQINNVPEPATNQLIKIDHLQKAMSQATVEPAYFQDLYASHGSTCLIGDFKPSAKDTITMTTDFLSLNKIHPALKKRLVGFIEKKKNYFILTGSDPSDSFGCCPSDEVGAANQLVKAGVLSACANQVEPQECPLTIYAFKDEIIVLGDDLKFRMNENFRNNVYRYLKHKTRNWPKQVIRWFLLFFVAFSLGFGYLKFNAKADKPSLDNIFAQIKPTQEDQLLVLLFHYSQRCIQCTRMESLTNSILHENFRDEVDRKTIKFDLINMDQIDYHDLTRETGLFTATMFLLKYDQWELKQKNMLKDAWRLYLDEKAFKKMLIQEVNQMLGDYE